MKNNFYEMKFMSGEGQFRNESYPKSPGIANRVAGDQRQRKKSVCLQLAKLPDKKLRVSTFSRGKSF